MEEPDGFFLTATNLNS